MSILLDSTTKVLVQGITGDAGSFHARQCLEYGTQIVAGVTPAETKPAKGKAASKRKTKTPETVAEVETETEAKAEAPKPKRAARKSKQDTK